MTVWLRTWQLGVKSLLLHPLRSLLTVLGIFIGVASVIWLLAFGEGISRKAQEQIEGLGAENIIVRSVKPPAQANVNSRGPEPYGVTRADFEQLVETVSTVDHALPIREIRRQFHNSDRYGDRFVDGRLVGCTPEYAEVTHLEVERGHFLTDSELAQKEKVCVLAAEVAERLFPVQDPLGEQIKIEEEPYTVVGVLRPRGSTAGVGSSLAAQDFKDDVYIPITTLYTRIGDTVVTRRSGSFEGEVVQLSQITLRINSVGNVLPTADVVREIMSRNHRREDWAMTVPLDLLEQAKTTRLMFIVLMGLIAAISLVVGGIGIMNIMLATVTERTREIGIRRALGAKRSDITRQFLAETIVLSVVGGITGVLGGLTCRPVTTLLREGLEKAFPEAIADLPPLVREITPEVVPWSIPVAFMISVGVGLVFGLYPATRAAAMDPIEALRHE